MLSSFLVNLFADLLSLMEYLGLLLKLLKVLELAISIWKLLKVYTNYENTSKIRKYDITKYV